MILRGMSFLTVGLYKKIHRWSSFGSITCSLSVKGRTLEHYIVFRTSLIAGSVDLRLIQYSTFSKLMHKMLHEKQILRIAVFRFVCCPPEACGLSTFLKIPSFHPYSNPFRVLLVLLSVYCIGYFVQLLWKSYSTHLIRLSSCSVNFYLFVFVHA